MNKLEEFFFNKEKKYPISKWHHYFNIYDKHLSKFINKSPVILEIGVYKGGSLEMWNDYFNNDCKIYGIDIDPECLNIDIPNTEIIIGDQGCADFWTNIKGRIEKPDIIIDDGGHHMDQQITTFSSMFNFMSKDGVYICEDMHTSYWHEFGGGYRNSNSFIEFTKHFIDAINAWHHKPTEGSDEHGDLSFTQKAESVTFYDSVIVVEKREKLDPPARSIRQ